MASAQSLADRRLTSSRPTCSPRVSARLEGGRAICWRRRNWQGDVSTPTRLTASCTWWRRGCRRVRVPPRNLALSSFSARPRQASRELGIDLAHRLNGEVVNADSMQLYQGMDVGTAKLTDDERQGVVHHLLDIWPVTRTASVADYQTHARGGDRGDCRAR